MGRPITAATTPVACLKLRETRKRFRLSQLALAVRADRSISTVARIERGVVIPTRDTQRLLAGALGVAVEQLFPEYNAPPGWGATPNTPETRIAPAAFRGAYRSGAR